MLQKYLVWNDFYDKEHCCVAEEGKWVKASEAEARIAEMEARIAELEARLEPCDVCKSIDCEESDKDYYIKRWKQAEDWHKDALKELENKK